MSATLAAEPVARLLGGCPIIHAEGRRFPVAIRYQRRGDQAYLEDRIAAQLPHALADTTGHILVFLPGVGEIIRCQNTLATIAERGGHALIPLYGDLPAEKQDEVLNDIGRRKIILSTNVAETSLTIDGVTAVIDSGQARQLRVSTPPACRGLNSSRSRKPRPTNVPAAPAGLHRASVGDSGKSRLTNRGPSRIRPRCSVATWQNPCCNYSHSASNRTSRGSIHRPPKHSNTLDRSSRFSAKSMKTRRLHRWGTRWRTCQPTLASPVCC